jgi:hypothetical protein
VGKSTSNFYYTYFNFPKLFLRKIVEKSANTIRICICSSYPQSVNIWVFEIIIAKNTFVNTSRQGEDQNRTQQILYNYGQQKTGIRQKRFAI